MRTGVIKRRKAALAAQLSAFLLMGLCQYAGSVPALLSWF